MKCSQCSQDAVGLCPTCLAAQCRRHLAEAADWYVTNPAITCVHRDRAGRAPVSADQPRNHEG